jgi:SRSO17 transposase
MAPPLGGLDALAVQDGRARRRPPALAEHDQRVRLLCQDPATAPHDAGALVVDDTGDRKDGTATAHVARQYLGSVGKIDNGIVAVTSLWADARCYWPVHAVPYTPASRLPGGERDPGFRTKPQLAVESGGSSAGSANGTSG